MQRNRLADFSGNPLSSSYAPLSHLVAPIDGGFHAAPSQLVLSHLFTLRGVGKLPDVTYPRSEAERRYAAPLGTSSYLSTLADEGYPVSGTFPSRVLFPPEQTPDNWAALETVPIGAHLMCTHSAAPWIATVNGDAGRVLKRRRHLFSRSFPLEADEWRHAQEECEAMYDAYNHGEPM
jgi:hypothetical protein